MPLSKKVAALSARLVPTFRRWGIHASRVGADTVREIRHDKITQLAAALTYHTLFSLLPTLVLAMVLLHVFVREEQRDQFRDLVVDTILPATPSAGGGAGREELIQTRLELTERVQSLLEQLDLFSFGGIGIVGLLVFIYGATALLATVERSFNAIFGVTRARPFHLRMALYYSVITLAPIPLIAGQVIQLRLLETSMDDSWLTWPALVLVALLPVLTAFVVLYLLYRMLPNTSVPRRAAAIGAVLGALGWALAKEAFRFYVANAAISSIYGALALLPLFLLWLWLSWNAVLVGLELAHTITARRGRGLRAPRPGASGPLAINPAWLLPIAAGIAEGHRLGEPRDALALSAATGLHLSLVDRLIDALRDAGLVIAVQGPIGTVNTDPAWVPARPAERILLTDLMKAAAHLTPPPLTAPAPELVGAWDTVSTLWQQAAANLGPQTLATLLEPLPDPDAASDRVD